MAMPTSQKVLAIMGICVLGYLGILSLSLYVKVEEQEEHLNQDGNPITHTHESLKELHERITMLEGRLKKKLSQAKLRARTTGAAKEEKVEFSPRLSETEQIRRAKGLDAIEVGAFQGIEVVDSRNKTALVDNWKLAWERDIPLVFDHFIDESTLDKFTPQALNEAVGELQVDVFRHGYRETVKNMSWDVNNDVRLIPLDHRHLPLSEIFTLQPKSGEDTSTDDPGKTLMEAKISRHWNDVNESRGELYQYKEKLDVMEPKTVLEKYVSKHLPFDTFTDERLGTHMEPIFPTIRFAIPFFTFGLHYDCYLNMLVQLHGRKRVVTFRYEQADSVRAAEIKDIPKFFDSAGPGPGGSDWRKHIWEHTLEPGQAVFFPTLMMHAVQTVGDDLVLGINFPMALPDDELDNYQRELCDKNFLKDYPQRSENVEKEYEKVEKARKEAKL